MEEDDDLEFVRLLQSDVVVAFISKIFTTSQEPHEVLRMMYLFQKLMNITTPSNIQFLNYFAMDLDR